MTAKKNLARAIDNVIHGTSSSLLNSPAYEMCHPVAGSCHDYRGLHGCAWRKKLTPWDWARVLDWLRKDSSRSLSSNVVQWSPYHKSYVQWWLDPIQVRPASASEDLTAVDWTANQYKIQPWLQWGSFIYDPESLLDVKDPTKWADRLTASKPVGLTALKRIAEGYDRPAFEFCRASDYDDRELVKTGPTCSLTLAGFFRRLNPHVSEKVLQEFSKEVEAAIRVASVPDPTYEFEELRGSKIEEFYENTGLDSCMTGSRAHATGFYGANPDKVALLIIRRHGSIRARGLLWKLGPDTYYLDRMYPSLRRDVDQAVLYYEAQGKTLYCKALGTGTHFRDKQRIVMNMQESRVVPYLDTFCYWDTSNVGRGVVTISSCSNFGDYLAQDYEDGGPFHDGTYYGGNRYCACCGDSFHEDELIWNDWAEEDQCRYCLDEGYVFAGDVYGRPPSNCSYLNYVPHDELVHSGYHDSYVWEEAASWSDFHNDYLLTDETIELVDTGDIIHQNEINDHAYQWDDGNWYSEPEQEDDDDDDEV